MIEIMFYNIAATKKLDESFFLNSCFAHTTCHTFVALLNTFCNTYKCSHLVECI